MQGKLIRDLLQEPITKTFPDAEFTQLTGKELHMALTDKLQEEVLEYLEAPNRDNKLEELADIYEVLEALVTYEGFDKETVASKKQDKKAERGGFEGGVYWVKK